MALNSIKKIVCLQCDLAAIADSSQRLRVLQANGHLQKVMEPSHPLIGPMFSDLFDSLKCPNCFGVGTLSLTEMPCDESEDDEFWGGSRKCDECRKPIEAGRLEVLPDATICAACARSSQQSVPREPEEFCERCGNVMSLRKSAQGARYAMYCRFCSRS